MKTHADKTQKNKNPSVANEVSQKQNHRESTFQFVDNRPEAIAQRKLLEMDVQNKKRPPHLPISKNLKISVLIRLARKLHFQQ